MDLFGIGTAVKGVVDVYFRSARCTGRTTALVNNVKETDAVVFLNHNQAGDYEKACRRVGKAPLIKVCQPDRVDTLACYRHLNIIFDHVWLEHYYKLKIDKAERQLYEFTKTSIDCEESPMMKRNEQLWRR